MPDRSISSPPSHKAVPAMLWPAPRTEASTPCSRANRTAAITSAAPAQRAISAGRLSIMAFQMARVAS